jgi:hypothetical protein
MYTALAAGLALTLAATDLPEPRGTETMERTIEATVVERSVPVQPAPILTPVETRELVPSEASTTAAQVPRGWLWTVAAIVVAGIILAVIL